MMLLSRRYPLSMTFVVAISLVVIYTLCRPEVGWAFLAYNPRIGLSRALIPYVLEGEKRGRVNLCRKAPIVVVFTSEQGLILSDIPRSASRRDTVDMASEVEGAHRNYTGQQRGRKRVPKWRMKLKSAFKGLLMGYSDKDEAVQFEYEKNMGRFTSDLNDGILSDTLANARLNFDRKAKEAVIENDDLLNDKGPNRSGAFATKRSTTHVENDTKVKREEDTSSSCLSGEKTPIRSSVMGGESLEPPRDSTGEEKYHNDAATQYKTEKRKFGNAADVAHLQRLFSQHVDDDDKAYE